MFRKFLINRKYQLDSATDNFSQLVQNLRLCCSFDMCLHSYTCKFRQIITDKCTNKHIPQL